MFNARLQVAFRGVPGEDQVREEQYHVLTHDQQIIDPQYWTDLVSPRSKLRMSVFINGKITDDKFCSRLASMTNSRDFYYVSELFWQRRTGHVGKSWRMGDGSSNWVWSKGGWNMSRSFDEWDQDLLRVKIGRKEVDIWDYGIWVQRRCRQR